MVALAEASSFVLICTGRKKILNPNLQHYLNTEDSKDKATEEFLQHRFEGKKTTKTNKNSKGDWKGEKASIKIIQQWRK